MYVELAKWPGSESELDWCCYGLLVCLVTTASWSLSHIVLGGVPKLSGRRSYATVLSVAS